MIADRIPAIQHALSEAEVDGWLFACFQHNDPVSLELLGLADRGLVTRRCYYLVPRQGPPRRLVHALEPGMLDRLPGSKESYLTWREHREALGRLTAGCRRLAAQYSPEDALPSISRLDLGTAELLARQGIELVSSADLVQRFAAVWTEEQLAGHRRAAASLHELVRAAFDLAAARLREDQEITERAVQEFLLEGFDRRGLWTEAEPIVGAGPHSADPHYQPGPDRSSPIHKGDFLLIDLWAKERAPASVYADITWCAVCSAAPDDRERELFQTVVRARDAALELIRKRYPRGEIRGFEVDDAARAVIAEAGYGEYFIHRTGHSIGISDHGQGANMDNLETHDTRRLLPMTGFSIEPGIYLPGDFGVRTEINVALAPEGAEVTGGEPQAELLRLLA